MADTVNGNVVQAAPHSLDLERSPSKVERLIREAAAGGNR
jgi:hypothetical protein